MDISYVGGVTASVTASTATNTTISLTGLTGGSGSAPVENDLVLVYYATGSTVSRALSVVTAGYTTIRSDYNNDTVDVNTLLASKRMGATPDTSVDVGPTLATADGGVVIVQVFRGVGSSATTVAALLTNTIIPNPPAAVTPAVTGGWLVMASAGGGTLAAGNVYTAAYLSNFLTLSNVAATNDPVAGMGTLTTWTTAYNGAAWTFNGTDSLSYCNTNYVRGLYPANSATMVAAGPASVPSPVAAVSGNGSATPYPVLHKTVGFTTATVQTVSLTDLTPAYTDQSLALQEGDLVIVGVLAGGTSTPTVTSAGWVIVTTASSSDTYDNRISVRSKRMGAVPDTSFDISAPTATFGTAVSVQVFRRARNAAPVITSVSSVLLNTAIPNPPAVTVTAPHTVFVIAASADAQAAVGLLSASDLTLFSSKIGSGSGGGNAIAAGVDGTLSGTVDPAALTYAGTGGTGSSAIGLTFVLANANENDIALLDTPAPTSGLPTVAQGTAPIEYIAGGDITTISTTVDATLDFSILTYRDPTQPTILQGDLVVVYIGTVDTSQDLGTITTAGYTTAYTGRANDSNDVDVRIAYKFMGATPDTSVTVSALLAAAARVIGVQIYRNTRGVVPITVTPNITLNTSYPIPVAGVAARSNLTALFAVGVNTSAAIGPMLVTNGLPVGQFSDTATGGGVTANSVLAVFGANATIAPTLSYGAIPASSVSSAIAATVSIIARNYSTPVGPTAGVPTTQIPSVGADGSQIVVVGQAAHVVSLTGTAVVDLTTITGGYASAPADGDVVVAMVAGSTAVGSPAFAISGYDLQKRATISSWEAALFTKVMGATPDTTLTVTASGVGELGVKVFVLRNVDPVSPMDVPATSVTAVSGSINAPAITPATTGALVFAFAEQRDGGTAVQPTAADYLTAWWADTGNDASWWALYGLGATGVADDPAILTGGGINDFAAITFAMKPYLAPTGTGYLKVWDGTAWVLKPLKVWDGSTWNQKPVKRWTGTAWV